MISQTMAKDICREYELKNNIEVELIEYQIV